MTIKLKGEEDLKSMTCLEKVKFYMSLCFGITALLSVFAFLFLIPFVVDPSITTIVANFDTVPVMCKTVKHVYMEGLSKCTWASCKEGCTTATPRCHQIHVNYSQLTYEDWTKSKSADIEWIEGPVKFFINTEGCGYPPRVNCTDFARRFGNDRDDDVFPCYYSKRYPKERAVAYFDWNDTVKNLLLAIGVPNSLFILSVGVLTYWYCWPGGYKQRPPPIPTTYATFDVGGIKSDKRRKAKHRVMYADDYKDQNGLVTTFDMEDDDDDSGSDDTKHTINSTDDLDDHANIISKIRAKKEY